VNGEMVDTWQKDIYVKEAALAVVSFPRDAISKNKNRSSP